MNLLNKSIFGGLSIAIASNIYLQSGGGFIGAILFSIGLLLILNMGFKLYTGTIGFVKDKHDIKDNIIILFGNIIGACGMLFFPNPVAATLMVAKLESTALLVFLRGIVCGIFIYSAVYSFKKEKDYMVPVCVIGFIMFGAEHCIADFCYTLAAGIFSFDVLLFLFIVALGNSIGAIIVDKIK